MAESCHTPHAQRCQGNRCQCVVRHSFGGRRARRWRACVVTYVYANRIHRLDAARETGVKRWTQKKGGAEAPPLTSNESNSQSRIDCRALYVHWMHGRNACVIRALARTLPFWTGQPFIIVQPTIFQDRPLNRANCSLFVCHIVLTCFYVACVCPAHTLRGASCLS